MSYNGIGAITPALNVMDKKFNISLNNNKIMIAIYCANTVLGVMPRALHSRSMRMFLAVS